MEFFNSPSSNAAEIKKKNLSSETTAMKSFLHFNVSQVQFYIKHFLQYQVLGTSRVNSKLK